MTGISVIVTSPYKFAQSSSYGISVCKKVKDLLDKRTNDKNNFLVFCEDLDMNEISNLLDHFNEKMAGYFYTVRVKSQIPIYYPMMLFQEYSTNLQRFEFNNNSLFYSHELKLFEIEIEKITQFLQENPNNTFQELNSERFNGTYMKSGESMNYTAYPIRLFIDNKFIHTISIIYISIDSVYIKSLKNSQDKLKPGIIIQIFLFIIMGGILILVTCFLIIAIAKNIIKPVRRLKELIKGMKKSNLDDNIDVYEKRKKEEEDEGFDYSNQAEDDLLNDDEGIDVRSQEIENLFNNLLKLKNVLSFTSNNNSENRNNLLGYIDAKYTFIDLSNQTGIFIIIKGSSICESNAGNLAMRFRKYDKAIFHLLDSIKDFRSKNIPQVILKNNKKKVRVNKFSIRACKIIY
jgi:methyl-accepting chemotaxis protein